MQGKQSIQEHEHHLNIMLLNGNNNKLYIYGKNWFHVEHCFSIHPLETCALKLLVRTRS